MTSEEQAVREVHAAWIEAVNAGDLATLLGMMAEDAVCVNPGAEPFGPEGLAANFRAGHEQFLIRCVSELEEVVVAASGDFAYTRARDTVTATPRPQAGGPTSSPPPKPERYAGHRLTIYRKHPDGRWRLARDAHTLTRVE